MFRCVLSSIILCSILLMKCSASAAAAASINDDIQSSVSEVKGSTAAPNIIFIVADDIGWNDVGWHNDDIRTPNLNALVSHGIELTSSYVSPICSPSRAALLTGVYPFRLGLQHGVLKKNKPHGLPLNVTTLPEMLKNLGYATHAIGKWHLGFCNWSYTPTYRGFDSFFGFYTGQQDYYNRMTSGLRGYDFRYNTKVFRYRTPKYSTMTFGNHAADIIDDHNSKVPLFIYLAFQAAHTPLQVPEKFERIYSSTKNTRRRKFSAMVSAVDDAVGNVITALKRRNMFKNTIVVFLSDNGASPYGSGNNWPLRGGKATLWEGGTRVPSFVFGKMLKKIPRKDPGLVHAVDWYPTLISAAGGNPESSIDGVSQWDMLRDGLPSNRNYFIYDINQVSGQAAIRYGKYKLIEGSPGHYSDWYPVPADQKDEFYSVRLMKKKNLEHQRHVNQTLLFNVEDDAIESNDLSSTYPDVVTLLKEKLDEYRKLEAVPFNPKTLRGALPKFWNGVWSPGWC